MNIEVVALAAAAPLALAVALQVGLAAGAPWGAAAYGGHAVPGGGALPVAYRFASGLAALTLLGAVWVVLASVSLVAALLGHKSAVETWDTYGHLMGDEDDRSRAVIDAALGGLAPVGRRPQLAR